MENEGCIHVAWFGYAFLLHIFGCALLPPYTACCFWFVRKISNCHQLVRSQLENVVMESITFQSVVAWKVLIQDQFLPLLYILKYVIKIYLFSQVGIAVPGSALISSGWRNFSRCLHGQLAMVCVCVWQGNLSCSSGAQARVERDIISLTSDQTTATSHSCVTVYFSVMSLCTWFSWDLKQ